MPAASEEIKCLATVCLKSNGDVRTERNYKFQLGSGASVRDLLARLMEEGTRPMGDTKLSDRYECVDVKELDQDFGGEMVSLPSTSRLTNGGRYSVVLALKGDLSELPAIPAPSEATSEELHLIRMAFCVPDSCLYAYTSASWEEFVHRDMAMWCEDTGHEEQFDGQLHIFHCPYKLSAVQLNSAEKYDGSWALFDNGICHGRMLRPGGGGGRIVEYLHQALPGEDIAPSSLACHASKAYSIGELSIGYSQEGKRDS